MAVTGASILGLTGKAHEDFVATVDRHALSMQPLDLEVEIRRQGRRAICRSVVTSFTRRGLKGSY